MQDASRNGYPDNPVLVRVWRGSSVESVHRGSWCLTDVTGTVLEGAGNWDEPVYARSSIKSMQALPLLETGAAERYGFGDEELALALASHSGEACHTGTVSRTLQRLGLSEADLRCGVHPPNDPVVRHELRARGEKPSQLHNNCSGKHTGFIALAKHLGLPLERYLDPESEGQQLVRSVLGELTGTPVGELVPAVDGCSAPTYRLGLRRLGLAFARITNPDGLAEPRRGYLRRLTAAVAANPVLIAGTHRRLDTDLVAATRGRLFPKIGAEGIYAIGIRGGERALTVKVDDGGERGLNTTVVALVRRLGLASESELEALAAWSDPRLLNHAGLEVGRVEAVVP